MEIKENNDNEISNNENKLNTQGNNQVSLNCNCIGKYSYKNTEAITIINNNTNENNNINTYYTERKSNNKTDITNNKINNSKNNSINDKNSKNSPNSKNKAINNKTNTNQTNKNDILTQNKNELEKEKLCLDLEILNSWNLPIGLQLHLDQYGLQNSIRQIQIKQTKMIY